MPRRRLTNSGGHGADTDSHLVGAQTTHACQAVMSRLKICERIQSYRKLTSGVDLCKNSANIPGGIERTTSGAKSIVRGEESMTQDLILFITVVTAISNPHESKINRHTIGIFNRVTPLFLNGSFCCTRLQCTRNELMMLKIGKGLIFAIWFRLPQKRHRHSDEGI